MYLSDAYELRSMKTSDLVSSLEKGVNRSLDAMFSRRVCGLALLWHAQVSRFFTFYASR